VRQVGTKAGFRASHGFVLVGALWLFACARNDGHAPTLLLDREIPVVELDRGITLSVNLPDQGLRLVEAGQDIADVRLELRAPDQPLLAFDAPARRASGPELACVTSPAGRLELTLTTPDKPRDGSRSLRLRIWSYAGISLAEAETRVIARCREGEAARERSPGRIGGFTASERAAYEDSARHWTELGEMRLAARAKLNAAWVETRRYEDLAAATRLGLEARAAFATANDEVGVALTALQLAVPRWEFARRGTDERGTRLAGSRVYELIDSELSSAEQVFEQNGLTFLSIEAHSARGANHFERLDYSKALATFREAADRYRVAGEGSGMERALANMNLVLAVTGDYVAASAAFDELVPDDGAAAGSPPQADILNNSADAHSAAGNYPKALLQHLRALAIHENWNDAGGAARSLNGVAGTYLRLGDAMAALDYSRRAGGRAAPDSQDKLVSLLIQGEALRMLGRLPSAFQAHEKAMGIAHGPVMQLRVRLELLRDALASRQVQLAEHQLAEAFAIEVPDSQVARLRLLLECARLALLAGRNDVAAQEFLRLRGRFAALGLDPQELEVSHGLALARFAQDRYVAALDANDETIARLKTIVRRVADPELRVRLTAAHRDAYALRVEALLALRKRSEDPVRRTDLLQRIFAAADATQRGLVGEMFDSRKLREQTGEARELVNQISMREHLLAGVTFGAKPPAGADRLSAELARLRTRYAALWGNAPNEPTASSGSYEFRRIPADTAILVFVGAARNVQRFEITRSGIRDVDLATPEKIGPHIDAALEELTAARDARPALTVLSKFLLSDATSLAAHRRWIVVTDNLTARVPFAALTLSAGTDYRPLVLEHEVSQALTVRDALTLARASPGDRRAPLRHVAIFSDPVFTRLDARVMQSSARQEASSSETLFVPITRLASSEREGREIAAALGPDRARSYSGFEATRTTALSDSVLSADTLHFATHAVASDAWPNGSGLLLTGTTRDGLPINGYLSTLDLLSRRARTELVVLGACDTARGESTAAENVAGLARAFLGSGARRVVATRWAVNDHATAALMSDFYRRQLEGAPATRALNDAQAAMASNPRTSDPRIWAVFVLYERAGN
jgi:CHAT domain-containing protein/tetratricopeptide (TPR) repeat protein